MRKCDTTKNKNKLWFQLEQNQTIKSFIINYYIKQNHTFNELKTKLQCSEGKLIAIFRKYNISKPRNLISKKVVETRLKNNNGIYETFEIKKKKQDTCLKKYGTAEFMQSDTFKNKRKNTMINKYGAEHTMHIPELKKKVEQTTLKRYGYKNAYKDMNWQHNMGGSKASWTILARKHRQLNYEKTGQLNSNWSNTTFNILKNKKSFEKYLDNLPKENRTISYIANDLSVIYDVIRNRYIKWNLYNKYSLQQFRSTPELEIVEFIKSFYTKNIQINTRQIIKPFELDIYLPDIKLGIEYNGEFWHKHKKETDKKKQNLCNKQNINLITILEQDYINNKIEVLNNIKVVIEGGEQTCQQI